MSLGNFIGAAKAGGSKLAGRFSKASRLSRKAAAMPHLAPRANAISGQVAHNKLANHIYARSAAQNALAVPSLGRTKYGLGTATGGHVRMPRTPRVKPNRQVNSGFKHGKKLMYGAAGVGAMGLAWGVTQRNKSTDSSGYRQSRGMYNY